MYSITGGNSYTTFAIDPNSGDIKSIGSIDYENTTSYMLTVTASDLGTPFLTNTTAVQINVNDLNDVIPKCDPVLSSVNIAEDAPVNTTIANVSCPDKDSGLNGAVTYSILSVDGASTPTPFKIDSGTGVLDLTAALDYESDRLKVVVVHAIDGGLLTGSSTIYVFVTDINETPPEFTNPPYTKQLSETTAVGDMVFIVEAKDEDKEDAITFSMNPVSSTFQIDPRTGEIYLTSSLDYETIDSYSFMLYADDGRGKNSSTTLTITVLDQNEGTPVFHPPVYAANISEDDSVGTTVVRVNATDTDSADTVTYSIASGNADGVFRIESSGLVIIDSTTNLDYEVTRKYTLIVHASDTTKTGTATVIIVVTGVNEDSPYFTSTSSTQDIPENSGIRHIIQVIATDADEGIDGDITYSITSGNNEGLFSVDPLSGDVTLVGELDKESKTYYVITITATDGGTNPGKNNRNATLHVSS